MLGSSASISDTNVMINTSVADVLEKFADRLEKAEDFDSEVMAIVRETVKKHKRIIFNGDGYSSEWQREAAERGLLNLRSTVDAVPYLRSSENVSMFEHHGVLNRTEINCRADIILENYSKILHIEALTLIEMIKRDVIPAVEKYTDKLCKTVINKRAVCKSLDCTAEQETIERLSTLSSKLYLLTGELEDALTQAQNEHGLLETARLYHDKVLWLMSNIRSAADSAEELCDRSAWPYPSYGDMLFKF